MASKLTAVAVIASLSFFSSALQAQGFSITLRAIDGRNGKPMPHQRLLVFTGSSQEDVSLHRHSEDVTTDENGRAVLQIPQDTIQWVQVFADFQTLCQSEPNRRSFSLAKVPSSGEASPNNCSSVRQELKPGQLTVFARPATFREKMAW